MSLSSQQLQSDLLMAGVVRGVTLISLIALVAICQIYGAKIQIGMDEQSRVFIRTVLYIVAITTFPAMKFIRHVLLRLNQTTKGNRPAKSRYLVTIIISMLVAISIGIYGFAMFVLGDSYNTLYIFAILSALAMYIYKPKVEEYQTIVESLAQTQAH
ncbi:MAG: hypothetical protein HON51_03715 [Gammaproteobacteria bacterium]|jgi:hypothetical protein|nr:hypothetical protein [Gammaproteobacteria bacterium]MBT5222393.1 hypothetical protein [Gammaproteobacteria bacterium]MBT5826145.1 hypothetical protein [Gammaproteobacteria bacterium]MBT6420677.1 hypothetical protein [Gammaproteobacteria bacterium]MBT6575339.1 hypothetical protein [Gammaproteobacteria bacterium]